MLIWPISCAFLLLLVIKINSKTILSTMLWYFFCIMLYFFLVLLAVVLTQQLRNKKSNNELTSSKFGLYTIEPLGKIKFLDDYKFNTSETIKNSYINKKDNKDNKVLTLALSNKPLYLRNKYDKNNFEPLLPYTSSTNKRPNMDRTNLNIQVENNNQSQDNDFNNSVIDVKKHYKHEKNTIRENWRSSCSKKAFKECKNACKQAYKNSCSVYRCDKRKKKYFKQECKSECKSKFVKDDSESSSLSEISDFEDF